MSERERNSKRDLDWEDGLSPRRAPHGERTARTRRDPRQQKEMQRRRMLHRKRRRRQRILILAGASVCLLLAIICPSTLFFLNQKEKNTAYCTRYESAAYRQGLYQETLYATSLCAGNDKTTEFSLISDMAAVHPVHAIALFDVERDETLYAEKALERLYPASTTKLMTAYVTLKYGNLEDTVVVGRNATIFEPEAQLCGLQEGDSISLYDLLCGLLLYSGNDNAMAIAEHISGSKEAFAELMNQEAWQLGATHSHFLNPHGLHEDEHYTTAYDLYLIFSECLKDSRFVEIISMPNYTGEMISADGSVRYRTWTPTNYYTGGSRPSPDGVRVIGGKTGTTNEAGSCLVLYSVTSKSPDGQEHPFISIVMGADTKLGLYGNMDALLISAMTAVEERYQMENGSFDTNTDSFSKTDVEREERQYQYETSVVDVAINGPRSSADDTK